jgi:hypothetical protein
MLHIGNVVEFKWRANELFSAIYFSRTNDPNSPAWNGAEAPGVLVIHSDGGLPVHPAGEEVKLKSGQFTQGTWYWRLCKYKPHVTPETCMWDNAIGTINLIGAEGAVPLAPVQNAKLEQNRIYKFTWQEKSPQWETTKILFSRSSNPNDPVWRGRPGPNLIVVSKWGDFPFEKGKAKILLASKRWGTGQWYWRVCDTNSPRKACKPDGAVASVTVAPIALSTQEAAAQIKQNTNGNNISRLRVTGCTSTSRLVVKCQVSWRENGLGVKTVVFVRIAETNGKGFEYLFRRGKVKVTR